MTRDDSHTLHELAVQCRRLARGCSARDVGSSLDEMAESYDRLADKEAGREAERERNRRFAGASPDPETLVEPSCPSPPLSP
jgi:hypothetical protein